MSVIAEIQSLLSPLVAPSILILADQNGARPIKPYATMAVRNIQFGQNFQKNVNANGIVQIIMSVRATTEIQYYGLNAFTLSQMLGLKLRYPSTIDRATAIGISLNRIISSFRVPELLNQSQYEERGLLEFTSSHLLIGTDEVGLIETLRLECFGHVDVVTAPVSTAP